MTLEARIGILRNRLVVEGIEYPIRHEVGGWVSLPSIGSRAGGRVRYDSRQDRIRIEGPKEAITISFHWRHPTFEFRGRRYQVGPTAWGHVMISRDDRPMMTGHLTLSGVRLGYVAPEVESIASELAVGLAFRAIASWIAMGAVSAARPSGGLLSEHP